MNEVTGILSALEAGDPQGVPVPAHDYQGDTGKLMSTSSGTSGPNLFEVPPTLTSVTMSVANVSLTGTLPNTTFRSEFFAAAAGQPFNRFLC